MQSQRKIEDIGFSPSFSCYSSDSVTSKAVAKVISEEEAPRFHEIDDVYEDDFEFSFEGDSPGDTDTRIWTVYPVFNRDLDLVNDELDHEVNSKEDKISGPLRKLFIDEQFDSSSYTSSEADELENIPSGTFCVWRPKTESGSSSPAMTKCKKSSSTGSGSKRWSIRYLLKRSNSESNVKPMVLSSSKQKRNSGEVTRAVSRLKGQSPVHEMFYVQRRAENEIVKRKSFLPYRQDLVGVFRM
ncbi:reverse transcriptase domain-containing protein [Tanacetum coccineum]